MPFEIGASGGSCNLTYHPLKRRLPVYCGFRGIEIGTPRGIRTLNLQILSLTQLPVMLPGH